MAWQNAGAGQNVAQMVQLENHGAQAYTLQGMWLDSCLQEILMDTTQV